MTSPSPSELANRPFTLDDFFPLLDDCDLKWSDAEYFGKNKEYAVYDNLAFVCGENLLFSIYLLPEISPLQLLAGELDPLEIACFDQKDSSLRSWKDVFIYDNESFMVYVDEILKELRRKRAELVSQKVQKEQELYDYYWRTVDATLRERFGK